MEGCSLDAFALNWDGWTSVSSEITFGIFWIPIWAWKMIPCELFVQSLLNCFFAMQSLERLRLVSVVEKSKRFCIVCRPRGLLDAHAAVLLEFYFGLCLSWTLIWWRVRKIMIQFLLLLFIQFLLLLFPYIKPELFYWDGVGWFSTTDLDASKHLGFL